MENLGYLAVLLGLLVSLYSIASAVVGRLRRNAFLEVSAQRAVAAAWLLVTAAAGILLYAILTNDFRLSYVASYSSVDQPLIYKFAAWWGGQEGSLLFWTWIASTYAFVAVPGPAGMCLATAGCRRRAGAVPGPAARVVDPHTALRRAAAA